MPLDQFRVTNEVTFLLIIKPHDYEPLTCLFLFSCAGVLPSGNSLNPLGFLCARIVVVILTLRREKPVLTLWLLLPPRPLGVTSGPTAHLWRRQAGVARWHK